MMVCRAALRLLLALCVMGASHLAAASEPDAYRTHRVARGEVLGAIAQRYGVTLKALCRENTIRPTDIIRPGQKLTIPGRTGRSEYAVKPPPPGASWAPYMQPAWRLGYLSLAGHGRSWKGYVVGPDDRVLPLARRRVTHVFASWRTGKSVELDERLVRLLAHVSDVFGGRTIRVVGGYREKSYARDSRHKTGEAIDFSIPGVPNDVLRDYLRTLRNVGVGYYPNSTHVHLDVRKKNGYWVDYSRPGRKPKYAHELDRSGRVVASRVERR